MTAGQRGDQISPFFLLSDKNKQRSGENNVVNSAAFKHTEGDRRVQEGTDDTFWVLPLPPSCPVVLLLSPADSSFALLCVHTFRNK